MATPAKRRKTASSVIVQDSCHNNTCNARLETVECSYTWTIDNFNRYSHVKDKCLYSPQFITRDSKRATWTIEIYPKGQEEFPENVPIYLKLLSSEEDAIIRLYYGICLVDSMRNRTMAVNSDLVTYEIGSAWGPVDSITRDYLFDEANKLLPDGQLTILLELRIIENEFPMPWGSIAINPIKVPDCDLLTNVKDLCRSKNFSDVTLSVGGQELRAHKLILAIHSPVFAAMFEHDMEESRSNRVEIKDINHDVLEKMLQLMYTGEVENLGDIADTLLPAAEKYGYCRLSLMCQNALLMNLNIEKAADTLILADTYNVSQLKIESMKFIIRFHAEVLETKGFESLSASHSHLVLEILRALSSSVKDPSKNFDGSVASEDDAGPLWWYLD